MRRIGVQMNLAADDPESPLRIAAFQQALQELGWTVGRNLRIDYRWGAGDADHSHRYAAELVALAPDVILASGNPAVPPLQQATHTVAIVFLNAIDPVGAGFVESLARPGGNITGFSLFEYGISAKWMELLREIAPRVTRAAVLRDPAIAFGIGQYAVIQAVAPSSGVELRPIGVLTDHHAGGPAPVARGVLFPLQRNRLSAAAGFRRGGNDLRAFHSLWVGKAGGELLRHWRSLSSYGPDSVDQYRRAAGYVDRILKGEKPADLPVQAPTGYELAINPAKALSLDVPPTLLALADEVIE
jgi:putative ABC transport system substrate-binding protein